MAKKDDNGKIKVLLFELEGNNETLKEGIKTIADTLSDKKINILKVESKEVIDNLLEEAEVIEELDLESNSENNIEEKNSNSTRKTKRTYSTPDVIELDLKKGSPNFEEFVKNTNPTSNSKKYLVIAYWLKEKLGIKEISKEHIYTCFKFMKWSVPADILQPLRSLKSTNGAFNNGEATGAYAINHVGENLVNDMTTPS